MRFAENRCDLITHTATKESVAPPEHVNVTPAFSSQDNHLDHKATVFLTPVKHVLADFFPATAAFKSVMYVSGKKFQSVASLTASVVADLQRADDERKMSTVEGGEHILHEAVHSKAVASMERARTAMTRKRQERIGKRILKLS